MKEEKELKDTISNSEKPKKERRKFSDTIIGLYLITFVILMLGEALGIVVAFLPYKNHDLDLYISFIGLCIVIILWIALTKRNKYMLKKLTFKWTHLLIGLVIGGTLNILCAFSAMLGKSLLIKPGTTSIIFLVLAFIFTFIQSSTEELLCRLFLYQRLKETYKKPWVVILASSIFFGAMHLSNPGCTIISFLSVTMFGVFAGILIYYFDSIWLVSAIHASWNYMQNFVLGLPNSGLPAVGSVYVITEQKNSFFYSTIFGVEGSAFALIVLSIACLITYLICRNKKVNFEEKELSN